METVDLRLLPSITFTPLTADEARELGVGAPEGHFVLSDARDSNRTYVVNAVIREFLELFRSATTVDAAIQALAARAGCDAAAVAPQVDAFARRMGRAGVLRRADSVERLLREAEEAPPEPPAADAVLVARGGDAELYRATGPDGRPVALRVLRDDGADRERDRERFRREFDLQRALPPHPNVCRAIAYCDAPRPMVVLEWIAGPTLRDAAAGRRLRLAARLRACGEAAAALAHLHAHGVLHGDVHARNFLRAAGGRVKLIDFGMARRSGERGPGGEVHGGVPKYMPPERVRPTSLSISVAPGDERAEVYQLGVLLYQTLAGRAPYAEHASWRRLAADIRDGRVLPLERTPGGERVPDAAVAVVRRAMAADPADRPPSAVALAAEWRAAAPGFAAPGVAASGVAAADVAAGGGERCA